MRSSANAHVEDGESQNASESTLERRQEYYELDVGRVDSFAEISIYFKQSHQHSTWVDRAPTKNAHHGKVRQVSYARPMSLSLPRGDLNLL